MSAIAPRDLKSVMFDPSNKTPKDPKKGRNSYKLKLDPKAKSASYKKKGIFRSTFFTHKRAPFINPCEQCLFYGYTRTYKIKFCYTKEIIFASLLMLIGIILLAAVGPVTIPVFLIGFAMLDYLIYLQLSEKFCPQDQVRHYCPNCGLAVADYVDPPNNSMCFGLIPGWVCQRENTLVDDFHNDGLIFNYEDAHPDMGLNGVVGDVNMKV